MPNRRARPRSAARQRVVAKQPAAAASPECARWSVRDGLAPPLPTSAPVWSGGALDILSDGSLSDDGLAPHSSSHLSTATADAAAGDKVLLFKGVDFCR